MKRSSKIIDWALVSASCEKTSLHKVYRREGWRFKNRHIALFGRDLRSLEVIGCIVLMLILRVTRKGSGVTIFMNRQWLYDSVVVLRAKLIAH
jgi:hypothetical protein